MLRLVFRSALSATPQNTRGILTKNVAFHLARYCSSSRQSLESTDILKFLNEADEQQLIRSTLTSRQAESLLAWRRANGSFRTLDDVTQVPAIGQRTIDKLRGLESPTEGDGAAKPKKRLPRLPVRPPFVLESAHKCPLASYVIVYTHPVGCAWALFNPLDELWATGVEVADWNAAQLDNDPEMLLHDVVDNLVPVADAIPMSENYIFAEQTFTNHTGRTRRLGHIDASLVTSLKRRATKPTTFYVTKFSAMPSLFELFKGGEVGANMDAVRNILGAEVSDDGTRECSVQDNSYGIRIEEELCTRYHKASDRHQEFMGRSLLHGITAYILCRSRKKPKSN